MIISRIRLFFISTHNKIYHYILIKIIESTELFDEDFYLSLYPDINNFPHKPLLHYITYGIKEGRRPSLFFDPQWYANTYFSLKELYPKNPLLHYILHGEKQGYNPCPEFNPSWYTQKYLTSRQSPLQHYIKIGLSKNLLPNKHFLKSKTNKKQSKTTVKIAVIIHAYYLEMLPSILSKIEQVSLHLDLFFTTPPEKKELLITLLDELEVSKYELVVNPHGGYDIAPFIQLLPQLRDKGYSIICKLHTKKGEGKLGEFWFNTLINSILGSDYTVNNIVSKFLTDKSLGLVGGVETYKSAKKLMYGNQPFINQILPQEKLSQCDWGFFTGTMFWATLDVFTPLINNKALNLLIDSSSHTEATNTSASEFHALERIFGLLPKLINKKTALSYPINLKRTMHTIKLDTTNSFSARPTAITTSLERSLKMNNLLFQLYYQ